MLWKTDVAFKDSLSFCTSLKKQTSIIDLKVDVEAKAPAIKALL